MYEASNSTRILQLHFTILPGYQYLLDTYREHLHITGELDSTVNILSGKRNTEVLNATYIHV